jgi:hypothetical protein
MGWSRGSYLFSTIISSAQKAIPDNGKRLMFYREIWGAFEDCDWDTQDECLGEDIVYDELYNEKYPDED